MKAKSDRPLKIGFTRITSNRFQPLPSVLSFRIISMHPVTKQPSRWALKLSSWPVPKTNSKPASAKQKPAKKTIASVTKNISFYTIYSTNFRSEVPRWSLN